VTRADAGRRKIETAASAIAANQIMTTIPLTHAAAAAEIPTPVTTVSQAAMHKGHLGRTASNAPGRIEAVALVPVER
jgi:hypothetical protein